MGKMARARALAGEQEFPLPRGFVRFAEWRLEAKFTDWLLLFLLVLYSSAWLFAGLGAFFNGDPAFRLGRLFPRFPFGVQLLLVGAGVVLIHELLHVLLALVFRSRVAFPRGWIPGFLPLSAVPCGPLSRDGFISVLLLSPVLVMVTGLVLLSFPPGVRTLAWIGLSVNAAITGGDVWLTVRALTFPGESLIRFARGRFEVYAPGSLRKEKRPGRAEAWRAWFRLFSASFLVATALLTLLTFLLQRLDVSIPMWARSWTWGIALEALPDGDLGLHVGFWPPAILAGVLTWIWMSVGERRRKGKS
ncbi:MAG: DUF3267 domain-containing protein [Armatimonadota bacterium]|nr:DUF3267 domain-containing protein [Armatimonadota bacterium]